MTGSTTTGGRAISPGLVSWLLDHARQDILAGRPIPDGLPVYVRNLLNPPTFPSEHPFDRSEIIEVSTAEAAKRTGFTVQHIRRLARSGALDGRKIGRDWLVTLEEHEEHDGDEQDTSGTTDPRRAPPGDPPR